MPTASGITPAPEPPKLAIASFGGSGAGVIPLAVAI